MGTGLAEGRGLVSQARDHVGRLPPGAPVVEDSAFLGKPKVAGNGVGEVVSPISSELSIRGPGLQCWLCHLLPLWSGPVTLLCGPPLLSSRVAAGWYLLSGPSSL